ncbi:8-amino-7-oxononanoate synthase [plant metagenome]|uniref:8-amino-7-oxononanoate synthase n=1 Tax=plant metagenome TaxID=1297885 RepID=A0A484URL0_9ZZZZ
MSDASDTTALPAALKRELIDGARQARQRRAQALSPLPLQTPIPTAHYRFDLHPGYLQLRAMRDGAARLGVENPYFKTHEGVAGATSLIEGRSYINFASYNYLGMAGDPAVCEAAKAAIDRYGTSTSASRLVSGERPVHQALERALADLYGVDDAVTFVSGHATNVTTIGHLFGPRDLILHDALIHNSVLQGIQLSGAHRLPFPHNDGQALERLLAAHRHEFERVLIVVEGLYSMDGDYPDLPRFVRAKQRHHAFLMVDEAHALGVLGPRGQGSHVHHGLSAGDVDIWMGTLSKTLAGCGGYIAGESALVEQLRFLAPGFLYSVGLPPALAAGSLAALRRMQADPERVATLRARGERFLSRARAAGVDTGTSAGLAIIPAIVGDSMRAARLSAALWRQGINAQPILHPAVPENAARLRFFLSCLHTEAQIDATVDALVRGLAALAD